MSELRSGLSGHSVAWQGAWHGHWWEAIQAHGVTVVYLPTYSCINVISRSKSDVRLVTSLRVFAVSCQISPDASPHNPTVEAAGEKMDEDFY